MATYTGTNPVSANPTNYVGHRSGQKNATGSSRELFLKLYAGEVMTAFQTKNIMMNYTRTRTISKGKSAQFIMTGKYRDAAYHTPGAEIAPVANAKNSERVVSVDDLLINAQFIPNIDEAMQHYDVRSIYTQEAGYGLSKVADQNILRMAVKAALTTNKQRASKLVQDYASWDDEDFTANVEYADNLAKSKKNAFMVEGLIEAKRILEMAGAPLEDLVCIMATDQYYRLFMTQQNSEAISNLIAWNRDIGGTGSINNLDLPTIAGIPVVRTPHLGTYAVGASGAWTDSLWSTGTTTGPQPLGSDHSNRAAQYDIPAAYSGDGTDSQIGAAGGLDASGSNNVNLRTEAEKVRAIVMHKDAVATVKLLDLSVESEYQIQRQGTLIVSKYAMGHNVLRPAMAVALHAPKS
tara:strand:- start:2235 stop:3455 length:1221 start_codon:yes stop_codon:yes gene_type:complete